MTDEESKFYYEWLELAIEAAKASTTDRQQLSRLDDIEIFGEG